MPFNRLPTKDPRTVARDIPGIFDALFPQLVPGIVAYFNRKTVSIDNCEKLPVALVKASDLDRSMLFEIAFARGEELLKGIDEADWNTCLNIAVKRQQRHFDAKIPDELTPADKVVADWVAKNMTKMLNYIHSTETRFPLVHSPIIPGYQWISSGVGDFSLGKKLIEVKCTNKHFSSADYRQIVMYWLLSYASSVEKQTDEWTNGIFINPRLNYYLNIPFNEIVSVIGAGRSKIELLELFASIVGEHTLRMQMSF